MGLFIYIIIIVMLITFIVIANIVISKTWHENRLQDIVLNICADWIANLQHDRSIWSFFSANNLGRIAILGYNNFSILLSNELNGKADYVCCIVEKHKGLSLFPGTDTVELKDLSNHVNGIDVFVDVLSINKEYSKIRKTINLEYPEKKVVDISSLVYYISEV